MSGIKMLCRMYGSIIVKSDSGNVRYIWDFKNNEAVPEEQIWPGSERWNESEKAKWEKIKEAINAREVES